MTIWTLVLWKMNIHMAKKNARKVVQRSFVKGHSFWNSLYVFLGISQPLHRRFNSLFLVSLLEAAIAKKMDVPLHPYSRLMHQKLTTLFWSLRRLVAAVHAVLSNKKTFENSGGSIYFYFNPIFKKIVKSLS